MTEQWMGIIASSGQILAVHLEINSDQTKLINQFTWKLQTGDEPSAYAVMYDRIKEYVENHNIQDVVIKGSAVGKNKATLAHLKSAEVRGVACVASVVGGADTKLVQKGTVSRTFGNRKVDDYVKDNSFWDDQALDDVTKGRREAALLILSQKD